MLRPQLEDVEGDLTRSEASVSMLVSMPPESVSAPAMEIQLEVGSPKMGKWHAVTASHVHEDDTQESSQPQGMTKWRATASIEGRQKYVFRARARYGTDAWSKWSERSQVVEVPKVAPSNLEAASTGGTGAGLYHNISKPVAQNSESADLRRNISTPVSQPAAQKRGHGGKSSDEDDYDDEEDAEFGKLKKERGTKTRDHHASSFPQGGRSRRGKRSSGRRRTGSLDDRGRSERPGRSGRGRTRSFDDEDSDDESDDDDDDSAPLASIKRRSSEGTANSDSEAKLLVGLFVLLAVVAAAVWVWGAQEEHGPTRQAVVMGAECVEPCEIGPCRCGTVG